MSGTRNTSTRIVLEGEAEYRAALKNINQEYRLCKSELEKLDAAFKGQQNTLDALQQKYKVLNDMLGQAKQKLELEKQGIEQSQQNMDKYAVKLEEAKKKLEALQSTKTEFLTAEQAKKVDLYTNAVHNYTVEAERLKTREAEIRQAMDSSAGGAEKYRAELNAPAPSWRGRNAPDLPGCGAGLVAHRPPGPTSVPWRLFPKYPAK